MTDWKKLKTSHGTAAKVPHQIAALVDVKAAKRLAAFCELKEAFYTPKNFCSVGAAAIPLFLEILKKRETPDQHRIYWLLTQLLTSDHLLFLATGIEAAPSELQAIVKQQEAQNIYQKIITEVDLYYDALLSKDSKVRSSAAFLLAFLPEAKKKSVAVLGKMIEKEQDAFAKASALLAVGLLEHGTGKSQDIIENVLTSKESQVVKGAAILALIHIYGEKCKGQLSDILQSFFELAQVDSELFFWRGGRVDLLMVDILAGAGDFGKRLTKGIIIKALRKLDSKNISNHRLAEWPSAALALYFTPDKLGQIIDASDLTNEQRDLLEELSQSTVFGWFAACGIPDLLPDRRRYLGLDPAGPMEMVIEYVDTKKNKYQWPVYRVLMDLYAANTSAEVIDTILRQQLDSIQILGVYAHLACYSYGIRQAVPKPFFQQALKESGKNAATWAKQFAQSLLMLPSNHSPQGEAFIAAFLPQVLAGIAIPAAFDAIVPIGGGTEEVRTILSSLSLERRENILKKRLAYLVPNAPMIALRLIVPLFDLCPTLSIAEGLNNCLKSPMVTPQTLPELDTLKERIYEVFTMNPILQKVFDTLNLKSKKEI